MVTMGRTDVYRNIKRHCSYIGTVRSSDYRYRTEQWKHGNVLYTVSIKVNPRVDKILRICARIVKQGGIYNVGV